MTNHSEINQGSSDFHSLQLLLEQKSKLFDQLIELEAECDKARTLYVDIKELRYRIQEISGQERSDLLK